MIQYKIKVVKTPILDKLFLIINDTFLVEIMGDVKSVINKKLSVCTITYLLDHRPRISRVYGISTISTVDMSSNKIQVGGLELMRIDNHDYRFFSTSNHRSITGIIIQEYELHSKRVLP